MFDRGSELPTPYPQGLLGRPRLEGSGTYEILLASSLIHPKEKLVGGKQTLESLLLFCILPSFSNRKFVQKNPQTCGLPLTLRPTDVAA